MTETKTSSRALKNQESRKGSPSLSSQPPSKKQHRKGENPNRLTPTTEQPYDYGSSDSWICKNSACRAVLSTDDTFCRRCSCCICHLFDDNKDPSLWLVCTSDSDQGDSCGLSCHIECALQRGKAGVVNLGQLMQLDGSYCCASCGKVSGILGCWRKQLLVAKDARRVDALCYRIFLSYRLLHGTSRFKDLHAIVCDAKSKLEIEVGPMNGVSAKMARCIVSRLSIAGEVQQHCALAIEKADEWLASVSNTAPAPRDSLPAACKFLFEEATSSSVVIVLIELPNVSSENVKGYKLWYCKSREDRHPKEPICVFPRAQRRILITNLQPCTEYIFRIISYTENGDLGHSEAKCFTKSVEIFHKISNSMNCMNHRKDNPLVEGSSSSAKMEPMGTTSVNASPGFKVRDLGKMLQLAWAQENGCLDGICSADVGKCCELSNAIKAEAIEEYAPCVSRGLDLNVASVPDLNEELTPPFESSRDEDNGCTLEQVVEADDAVSHDAKKNNPTGSHGSGDSQTEMCRKRAASTNEETLDCVSTLINGSPFSIPNCSGCLDENFEYCVKIIRWLECEGHIKQGFRLKLLTWFSLRSTEQERRVVSTYIKTLIDDPSCLAGQLVDSFSDIVTSKKPRSGLCSKLWH